jgi:hypothetical protein
MPDLVNCYLDGPVPSALDPEPDPLTPLVQLDRTGLAFDCHDSARLVCALVHASFRERKYVIRGNGEEGAVQSLLEVAIVGADRVVHGNKVGAGRKGALDH